MTRVNVTFLSCGNIYEMLANIATDFGMKKNMRNMEKKEKQEIVFGISFLNQTSYLSQCL